MDSVTRKQLLESFGAAPGQLKSALNKIDPKIWPLAPDIQEWSIRQIIFHLTDSEANYYVRFRKAIAESGGIVVGFDQNLWTDTLDFAGRSTDESVELFRLLRTSSYHLLTQLPETAWANFVQHSERGKLTLENLLSVAENHITDHLKQIEANVKKFNSR